MKAWLTQTDVTRLSETIAARTGLHFPGERWPDLERGLMTAAEELGFPTVAECAEWLLNGVPTRGQIAILASHLTIGETYFFRDQPVLQALSGSILPELIRTRRGRDQRLRLWSAACCSGEEPYSLAILLHQMLPDLRDWNITITATDINPRFLQKAATGIYGEWSFRNAPSTLRQRYFTRVDRSRYAIIPDIRQMVTFEHLNLVEDLYPSLATNTNAMDVIFCRNVLMYFTPAQVRKVIESLRRALMEGGWLAVSPSEASKALFPDFASVNFPGAIFFRKTDAATVESTGFPPPPSSPFETAEGQEPPPIVTFPTQNIPETTADAAHDVDPLSEAESLYQRGRYEDCVATLLGAVNGDRIGAREFSLLARARANQGGLSDALSWCDRWVAADKMNAAAHYLRAVVLIEQGQAEAARQSLQRAVYLDPDFVLAHFALGNLATHNGKSAQAERHFANALHLLRSHAPEDLLPESEGLTAGRLAETITSIMTLEYVS